MPGIDHDGSTGLPRDTTRMYPKTSRGLGTTRQYPKAAESRAASPRIRRPLAKTSSGLVNDVPEVRLWHPHGTERACGNRRRIAGATHAGRGLGVLGSRPRCSRSRFGSLIVRVLICRIGHAKFQVAA